MAYLVTVEREYPQGVQSKSQQRCTTAEELSPLFAFALAPLVDAANAVAVTIKVARVP